LFAPFDGSDATVAGPLSVPLLDFESALTLNPRGNDWKIGRNEGLRNKTQIVIARITPNKTRVGRVEEAYESKL